MTTLKTQSDHYFGGCPECGDTDGYLNAERVHFFICNKHKTRWRIGENLFSSWHEETEADWRDNAKRLASYREVKPMLWEPTPEEKAEMGRVAAQAPYIDPLDNDIPF